MNRPSDCTRRGRPRQAYPRRHSLLGWAKGGVDHDVTRVIAGIADTALRPEQAAVDTLNVLREMAK